MSRHLTIEYECAACGHKFDIECTPVIPAKTWGPPEKCYPAEGGEFEPDECPECDAKVDADAVFTLLDEQVEREVSNAAEREAERRAEAAEARMDAYNDR